MKNETFVAVCLFGLESLLGGELDALGCRRTETIDGRIWFEAPMEFLPKINIGLRYAERVLLQVGSFPVSTFSDLFDGTYGLPWDEYIYEDDAFPVRGHSIKSVLKSVPDCQSIIKKAVAKKLGQSYGMMTLPESGEKKQIDFFILKDVAYLMIDTTGEPLHKRGYRSEATEAPLRETLAAAMAEIARPKEDVLFWDPMCGSGTIAVEAALIATDRAPGLYRGFASESYDWLRLTEWTEAREAARARIRKSDIRINASDISPEAVQTARRNIERAGVSGNVSCFVSDALKIRPDGGKGTIVCNPPYGERLATLKEAERLYRAMGEHFLSFGTWHIYVLTSDECFERCFGKRADKVRKLYNGMIKCGYYQYFRHSAAEKNNKK